MTEEEFYKKKVLDGVKFSVLRSQNPNLVNLIKDWYCSERYNKIQNFKSLLKNKSKQLSKYGEPFQFSNEQIFEMFKWWEVAPKVCYYCSLPESELINLHDLPGHINKRYPRRGQSLEIDRKQSDLPYSVIDNLVLACYWCNNAKTDTFTEEEFMNVGEVMRSIWRNRLGIDI